MSGWWQRDIVDAQKWPLMLCFAAFVATFVVTRLITRLIRTGRGPFRDRVTGSGVHIHHSVPGIALLVVGAFIAVGTGTPGVIFGLAAVMIGAGVSLVLDEFALILHLQDVYWSNEGRLSVNLVSLTAAYLGLALTGLSPTGVRGRSPGRRRAAHRCVRRALGAVADALGQPRRGCPLEAGSAPVVQCCLDIDPRGHA